MCSSCHERRSFAGRHLRPQADAYEVRRPAVARERHQDRAQDGRAHEVAVRVLAARRERSRDLRDLAAPIDMCRRHVHRAIDDDQHPEPRAVTLDDEYRAHPAGSSVDGSMAHLRSRNRQSESARVRRLVPGPADRGGAAAVGSRIPAGRTSRHLHLRSGSPTGEGFRSSHAGAFSAKRKDRSR